jgi:hypothetical protein
VDDLKTNTIVMGATANSADNFVLPMLANALIGTRMQVLTGYVGQNEIDLAVERGEVQGNNTGLSNLTAGRADWVRDNKVRILLQYGDERLAVLKDVPTVAELTASDADREMLRFYALKFTMTRPLMIPPDVPPFEKLNPVREAQPIDKVRAPDYGLATGVTTLGSSLFDAEVDNAVGVPPLIFRRARCRSSHHGRPRVRRPGGLFCRLNGSSSRGSALSSRPFPISIPW